MNSPLMCRKEERRETVRASYLNGIDYVEVGEAVQGSGDRRQITVYFLGKAPAHDIRPANVRIAGGRAVEVTGVSVQRTEEPDRDDSMIVVVDRPGDQSTYTLSLVEVDDRGRPTDQPLEGLDRLYASIEFRFDTGCDTALDCRPREPECPAAATARPAISYLAKDYASFRQLILDRLAIVMPQWRERSAADFGIVMVELMAYAGDYLSFYQDAVATEAYLDTARRRTSVRRHARLVDYPMHEGVNARTWMVIETAQDWTLDPAAVLFATHPPGLGEAVRVTTLAELDRLGERVEYFEALSRHPVKLYETHNRVRIYTWGNRLCCLEKGATSATLAPMRPAAEQLKSAQHNEERGLHFSKNDVVVFQEVLGPRSGDPDDADPAHRHAVRLTKATRTHDPLMGEPVWEVEWAAADALPFPLCISSLGPDCRLIDNVSIAFGNVILADHGRTLEPEELPPVEPQKLKPACLDIGVKGDIPVAIKPYRPTLKSRPVVFSTRANRSLPASLAFAQDPGDAAPTIKLRSEPPAARWEPRRDLLASGPDDYHFVLEVEDDGGASLRFGDGVIGAGLAPGQKVTAVYRVGGGDAGNVGAGAVSLVVFRANAPSGLEVTATNPMPARGGTDPEPIEQVKLLAPHAFRSRLERAVVPADYAALAQRNPKIQRAAAVLRWTGAWQEILVVIDPKGAEMASPDLLAEVQRDLERYRRIGHDVVVAGARRLPVAIELMFCPRRGYHVAHLREALLEAFSTRRFFHPDSWTFGQPVVASAIVAAALRIEGVESVVITKLSRIGIDAPETEDCIKNGLLPVGPQEVVQLENDPDRPFNGVFDAVAGGKP